MAIRGLSYSLSCGSSLLSCQWRLQAETAGRVCHKAEPAKLQNKVDDLFKRADPEENAPACASAQHSNNIRIKKMQPEETWVDLSRYGAGIWSSLGAGKRLTCVGEIGLHTSSVLIN